MGAKFQSISGVGSGKPRPELSDRVFLFNLQAVPPARIDKAFVVSKNLEGCEDVRAQPVGHFVERHLGKKLEVDLETVFVGMYVYSLQVPLLSERVQLKDSFIELLPFSSRSLSWRPRCTVLSLGAFTLPLSFAFLFSRTQLRHLVLAPAAARPDTGEGIAAPFATREH